MRCSKCGADNREGRKFCGEVRRSTHAFMPAMRCFERTRRRLLWGMRRPSREISGGVSKETE